MAELLRTEGLRKYYGVVSAAADINLSFQEGVLTSIIGPNGAGKTTFIHLLTGHVRPDRGRILFQGEDITRLPTHARVQKGISRSFQVGDIFPRLSVGGKPADSSGGPIGDRDEFPEAHGGRP